MAIFPNIEYKYYDSLDKFLGVSAGFLNGISKYPDATYAKKYVGEQEVKTVHIVPIKTN